MKLFYALDYWAGAVIIGLCFLPFVLVAVVVGLVSYVSGQIREFRLGLR